MLNSGGVVIQESAARVELLKLLRAAVVRGHFILSSGGASDWYVDVRKVSMSAPGSRLIGDSLLDLTSDVNYDCVGGLTLGADPVAAAVMHRGSARIDMFSVRRTLKQHGLHRKIEGSPVSQRRVLIVDDTVTTGRSPLEAADAVSEAGGIVVCVACVVDRGAEQAFSDRGISFRSLFTPQDLGVLNA